MKTQNTKLRFKIKEAKDEKLYTDLVGYEIVTSSLKRLVHKNKDKIDDSFILTTKDNVKIRVKPFIVTKSSTNRSVLKALRKQAYESLADAASKNTYDALLENIVKFKIQASFKGSLSKIYPITQFHIRKLEKLNS